MGARRSLGACRNETIFDQESTTYAPCSAHKLLILRSRNSISDRRISVELSRAFSPVSRAERNRVHGAPHAQAQIHRLRGAAQPICWRRVSIMVLPTKWIFPLATPSFRRFSTAKVSVVNSRSEMASVHRRLIFSGMDMSRDRRPAST